MSNPQTRSCANCCAFKVLDGEVKIGCGKGVAFRPFGGGGWRAARSYDACDSHKTHEEDAEGAALDRFRATLGLPPTNSSRT